MDSPYFYVGENPICDHVDTSNFRQNRIRYLQFRDPPIPKSYYAYGVANCYACRFFAVLRKTLILCQKGVAFHDSLSQVPKRYLPLNDKTVLSYPHHNFLVHAISGKIYPKFSSIYISDETDISNHMIG